MVAKVITTIWPLKFVWWYVTKVSRSIASGL